VSADKIVNHKYKELVERVANRFCDTVSLALRVTGGTIGGQLLTVWRLGNMLGQWLAVGILEKSPLTIKLSLVG
jgi:hypothetical protein